MKFATTAARHQRILALLRDRGEIRASSLVRELGVTPMTVWRDLKLIGEQGLLRRVRGGAFPSALAIGEPDFETKATAAGQAKARIAEAAVREFVREGDVIALEGGTTVAALVDALPEHRISVITNSLPVALRIRQRRPSLPVRVIGGWLSPISGNTTGPGALREASKDRVSVCFLSATGWDPAHGPMDPNPLEIEVKRAFAECAGQVVLLMDSRKFATKSTSVMMHPRRITALVTDAMPPKAIAVQLRSVGVRVVLASADTKGKGAGRRIRRPGC